MLIEELRSYKVGPFAIFDTAISYLGILIVSPLLTKILLKFGLKISVSSWLWLTIPISIIFHLLFSQQTPLIKILNNPRQLDFYVAITILLFMTYMGLKNINRTSN